MCFFICKLFSVLSEEFHFLGCALRSSRTLEMFWVTYCSVCCLLGLFFNCEDGGRTFFHILVHYETARCHIAEDSFLHLFLKPLTNLHVNFQTELWTLHTFMVELPGTHCCVNWPKGYVNYMQTMKAF
jgi:hypothetical protein